MTFTRRTADYTPWNHNRGGEFMGGSIQWDKKSKSFYVAVYWDGKHHRIWRNPVTGEKLYVKHQAAKVLAKVQSEVDEKIFNPRHWRPDNPMRVDRYYKEWLAEIDVTPKVKRNYQTYFERHINPIIGGVDLRAIRKKHVVNLKRQLALSDKGRYNVLGALKTMLRWAWGNDDIPRVPPFPRLSFNPPQIVYLNLDQQEEVLAAIPDQDRPIFQIGMEYGLRVGEVRAIQWDSVSETELVIRRTFSDNQLRHTTKTGRIRALGMTAYAWGVFRVVQRTLSPFVFVTARGVPYSNKVLNRIWHQAEKKVGIKIKLYNAFRHSLGCQLLDLGESEGTVQDIYGHSTATMTRRYATRSTATITAALERRRGNVVQYPFREKGLAGE